MKERTEQTKAPGDIFFGPFRLDTANERLLRGIEAVALRPKAFAVLRYLVEHRGQLVNVEELLKAVWQDIAVSKGVVKGCIREIRKALGDTEKAPQFIEAVPRRGYRFIKTTTKAQRVEEEETRQVVFVTGEAKIEKTAAEAELRRLKRKLLR
jgi:DNA-binding winged helix-turn-helix (wHTH) protein